MQEGAEIFTGGGEVIDVYVCSVADIDDEFKIGMKHFMVTAEAENGNIFKVEVTENSPAAPEAFTAPP